MAIGHLTPAALKAMREHGHVKFWEVASYGGWEHPDSVTVECTKCMEVLVELVNPDMEKDEDEEERRYEDAMRKTEDGDECPLCKCGTVEHVDGVVNCRGECGASVRLTPSRGDAVYCQNCDWEGEEADCNPIADIHQRVAAGEPMPAGECPKCGALCQLKETP